MFYILYSKYMVKYSWSAPLWESFHYLCANCKDNIEEISKVKQIIVLFVYIIPCITCKSHAIKYISNNNLKNINTKKELSMYMYIFHNTVKTSRARQRPTHISILKKYEKSNKQFITAKINIGIRRCLEGSRQLPRYINLCRKRSSSIMNIFNTMVF